MTTRLSARPGARDGSCSPDWHTIYQRLMQTLSLLLLLCAARHKGEPLRTVNSGLARTLGRRDPCQPLMPPSQVLLPTKPLSSFTRSRRRARFQLYWTGSSPRWSPIWAAMRPLSCLAHFECPSPGTLLRPVTEDPI